MGTVIYSASPIQAFLGSLGPLLLIFVIGLGAIGIAIFRRRQPKGMRILTGVLGGFLVIVSFVVEVFVVTSAASSTTMIGLKLDNKRVVEDNCGDNGETCARYVLESTTHTSAYDFNVTKDTYDKAQVSTCYNFTYYPNKGLFSNATDTYQEIDRIALIETADPVSCQ